MRKNIWKASLIALPLVLAGCASQRAETPASGDVGLYPDAYQQIVRNHLSPLLRSPDSAIYANWRGPKPHRLSRLFEGTQIGYAVCVDVAARDRHGAYADPQRFYFLIRDNSIATFIEDQTATTNLCRF